MPAPLTLIVEDGTGVSGANSYASIVTITNYASYRGVSLQGTGNPQILSWAILAMDYIESFADRFKGRKTNWGQALQWPRKINLSQELLWDVFSNPYAWQAYPTQNVTVRGQWVLDNQIPPCLVACQCQLVLEQNNGVTLFETSNPNETIKLQRIGPITTEYFQADNQPLMPAVDSLLDPLLDEAASSFLSTIRV